MTGLFATLILCDACGHGVDHHSAAGCNQPSCECLLTRSGVIEATIAIEVRESAARFRKSEPDVKASGF